MGLPKYAEESCEVAWLQCKNEIYTTTGGNSPQIAINELANRIKDKQIECALLSGGEALDTFVTRLKDGLEVNWSDEPGGEPEIIGKPEDGTNDHEKIHGIFNPSSVYPLFANSLRGLNNQTVQEHMNDTENYLNAFQKLHRKINTPGFPIHRSAEEIALTQPENRMIGLPYTKYMNSIMRVNQSCAFNFDVCKKGTRIAYQHQNGSSCTQEHA